LWVFSLIFPSFFLRGTVISPLHKIPQDFTPAVAHFISLPVQRFP
jgi:hypothetical protein